MTYCLAVEFLPGTPQRDIINVALLSTPARHTMPHGLQAAQLGLLFELSQHMTVGATLNSRCRDKLVGAPPRMWEGWCQQQQ